MDFLPAIFYLDLNQNLYYNSFTCPQMRGHFCLNSFMNRAKLRNIAIIAHVDHGKTTLVDAMLKQSHAVKDGAAELIMDSMDLEKERGITIKAKNASLIYKDYKINIIDTPGHADFGGEVERTLKMADGVLLLVDAKEGPMPQTKFVLKKALELGHQAIVVINKVDKDGADPEHAVNKTFDLFVKLNASDKQLDFPIIYASARMGLADKDLENLKLKIKNSAPADVSPLFEAIIKNIPAPEVKPNEAFAIQILALIYDNYKGRMGIGKIVSGSIKKSENVMLVKPDGSTTKSKITALMMYQGMVQVEAQEAQAGDVVAIAGFDDIHIGDVLTDPASPVSLPPVEIEPPTIKMTFGVNTSPFAGREGKFVTSRNLRDRLIKELETNVALKVSGLEQGSESFLVSGRGELHLAILIETMRREGFELQVSQPEVIYHIGDDGKKLEPYEIVTIDVPSEHQGVVIEELGKRDGHMQQMETMPSGDVHAEYLIPTRGLIGLKNQLITRTRGTAVINNLFDSYKPTEAIDEHINDHGSLIASESGISNAYGLNNAQERGTLFIGPALDVYEGMVVGQNRVNSDLEVNICKTKKLSNMRSSGADEALTLTPPKLLELDFALEYVGPDELVEVTPESIRIRKKALTMNDRKRAKR